jgi:hypothetical protein
MIPSPPPPAHPRVRAFAELVVVAAGVALLGWAWRADRNWYELHVGDSFCIRNAGELSALRMWRWIAVVAGTSLLIVLRPIAGRWAGRRSAGGAAGAVARIACGALLALVVCDLVLRIRRRPSRFGVRTLPPIHRDARYGWAHDAPKTTSIRTDGRDIAYAMNARGERVKDEHDLPDRERPTILVAGESIASGVGVMWEESFAGRLEQQLRVQVLDSAVQAYDADQAYVRMRDELTELAHPLAVVTLTTAQQVVRRADPAYPYLSVGGNGALEERLHQHPGWWVTSPVRDLADRVVFLHDGEPLRVARALFAETARAARARGAYPLFLLTNWGTPCLPDETGAPSIERRLFGGLDVPHVRVDLDPTWEEPTTHHPGPKSHARMADAIAQALFASHVLERPER